MKNQPWMMILGVASFGLLAISMPTGCSQTSATVKSTADQAVSTTTGAAGAAKDMTLSAAEATMSAATTAAEDPAGKGYYQETTHEGRILVFGTPEAYQEFQSQGRVPEIRRTLIGGGPNGETVYIEADKKGDMADRLHGMFKAKHGM